MQDNKTLKSAKKGDMKAFENIIVNYEKLYFNIAFRILNNREDAKDAAQESLLKIYKNIEKCDDIKLFKSWSCKIVTNTSIDYLRSKSRRPAESLDERFETDEGEYEKQTASKEDTPEETFIKKEVQREVLKMIDELPEKYKTVLVLRDLNGLSYDEISLITENSLGTVKSRISRARSMMREKLNEKAELNNRRNV